MDIVLPLIHRDLERYLRLQRPTFERCYTDLGRTTIITPPRDVRLVERATRHLKGVEVVNERRVVPELTPLKLVRRQSGRDWYMQQLIKLAAVLRSTTPFALVLDSDVVATRAVRDADLVSGGRALRPRSSPDVHPEWVRLAGVALGVEPLGYSAAVTPSVLARDAVAELAAHTVDLRPRHRLVKALAPTPVRRLLNWRIRLLDVMPWTEYQLYDTFLVRSGRFDQFHFVDGDRAICGHSVWADGDFDIWNPTPVAGESEHYFAVIQSHLGIPVEDIEERLAAAGLLFRGDA